jgi:acyl-homoserine-lactone acylase
MASINDVTIRRDGYGVPHILAPTHAALFYGFGYAQAEDRLLALFKNIKQAKGELAEWNGIESLAGDVATRAFLLALHAAEKYATLPLAIREEVEAFAAGINRYQADFPQRRPEGAFIVTPQDIVTFALFVNMTFATEGLQAGSNAFVVAPPKVDNGRGVIVSLDPHLPFDGFYRWYEARLQGGDFNIHGITFAGLPYLVMGCNGQIAWANTVNNPDLSDSYQIRTVGNMQYEYDNTRRDLTHREFVFHVKGGKSITRRVAYTHHGPILSENTDIAVRKAGVGDVGILIQSRAQSLAQNANEYRAALRLRHVVMFNHLYGDVAGNIGYAWGGHIPERRGNYDYLRPVPGWTSQTEWGDITPFDQLPQCENPPSHFLQNCNDGPTRTGAGEYLLPFSSPSDYPNWLAPDTFTQRGARLHGLLKSASNLSLADAQTIAMDCRDLNADTELPTLLAAIAHKPLFAEAYALLSSWDRTLTINARGATLFQLWRLMGGMRSPLQAFQTTISSLTLTGIPLDVPWGFIHRHKRGSIELPMDGGSDSLCPNIGEMGVNGRIIAQFGSSYRMLARLGAKENSDPELWAAQPYGQSDHPNSLHFADQMTLACEREYRRVPWTEKALEDETTAQITL